MRLSLTWPLLGILWLAIWPGQATAISQEWLVCLGPDHKAACDELVAQRSLFPPGTFGETRTSGFILLWYSEQLAALGESALHRGDDPTSEVYRFLWLRTFDRPAALRLQRKGGEITLTVREASGAGGYDPGSLVTDKIVKVSTAEWDAFLRLLEEAGYWDAASTDPDNAGLDGVRWILEAVKDGQYHIVDRWSPDPEHSPEADLGFRRACLYFLKLSGLKAEPLY